MPHTPSLSQRMATALSRLRFDQLPEPVVAKAIELLAYHVALALKARDTAQGRQAVGLAGSLSEHGGDATVLGASVRTAPIDAAFANSSLMRALECDDVLMAGG